MEIPGIIFGSSIVLFAAYALMVRVEEINARRFIGGRLRASLDLTITRVEERWVRNWRHLSRYVLQLGWYYSIHSLLKTLLQVLVSVYTYIEHIFEKNRARTKQLRKEFKKHATQSHLTHLTHHREKTTLTPQEQAELRTKTLENDHR